DESANDSDDESANDSDDESANDSDDEDSDDSSDSDEDSDERASSELPEHADADSFLDANDVYGLWLWSETPDIETILNDEAEQDDLLSFLSEPHGKEKRAINRLFLEARDYSVENRWEEVRDIHYDPLTEDDGQKSLRSFISRAKDEGMGVEYLDGQAIWLATDENAEAAKEVCRDVTAFNEGTDDETERFDGVHFDIEPHTVQEGPYAGQWWEDPMEDGYNAEWTKRWEDILDSCRNTLDDYEEKTGHRMTLASDLGADYSAYNQALVDILNEEDGALDYVSIMNYYDNRPNAEGDPSYFYGDDDGDRVVGGVVENLEAWDELPVMFAVETGPESIAPDWMSFHQEGYEVMYDTLDDLYEEYGDSDTLGAAIHHYGPDSFRSMDP
ncbi:MAG: hypothetical protein ACOCV2_10095, partial [Persicimonas sp.]